MTWPDREGDRRERSDRAVRGQDHDVRDGGTHRRLEECVRVGRARVQSRAATRARQARNVTRAVRAARS